MITGTEVIRRALEQISATSKNSPASPETLENALKTLNSFMQELLDGGTDFGQTPLEKPDDQLNIVQSAEMMVIYNLARRSAPPKNTGREVITRDLLNLAKITLADIKRRFTEFDIPNIEVSSTTPRGAGSRRRRFFGRQRAFFGNDPELRS